MDIKESLNLIDSYNIDDIELAETSLSEEELKRTKDFIDNLTTPKFNHKKYLKVAVLAMFFIISIFPVSALAQRIPFISSIYEKLGIFTGYENYTNYIGITNKKNGFKVTIDNIAATKDRLVVSMNVYSEKTLAMNPKDDNFIANISMNVNGVRGSSSGLSSYYRDEHNVLLVYEEKIHGSYSEKGTLKLDLLKQEKDSLNEELSMSFDMNVDFSDAFSQSQTYTIEKQIFDNCILSKIDTTIMGTDISLNSSDANYNIESDLFKHYPSSPKLYLEIDGILHFYDRTTLYEFNTVTSEIYKNAKSINLIVAQAQNTSNSKIIESSMIFDMKDEFNILYPNVIESSSGKKCIVSKIERTDDNIKFHLSSEFNPLAILSESNLVGINTEGYSDRRYERYAYKDTNNKDYVLEFKNVDKDDKVKLNILAWQSQLDNYTELTTIPLK